jgi:hypothetical protein
MSAAQTTQAASAIAMGYKVIMKRGSSSPRLMPRTGGRSIEAATISHKALVPF